MEANRDNQIIDHVNEIVRAADAQLAAAAELNRAVRKARRARISWANIGAALGTSKQAAQQRFAATVGENPATITFKEP